MEFHVKAARRRRRGCSGSRVGWAAESRWFDAEETWCKNHPKLVKHCGRALDIRAPMCERSLGCRTCVVRRAESNEAFGDAATSMGTKSDDLGAADRAADAEDCVGGAGNVADDGSEEEIDAKENHHALADRADAFAGHWTIQSDGSGTSDDSDGD